MRITSTLSITPPFEVGSDPFTIVDAEGSVVAKTNHIFTTELLVNALNLSKDLQQPIELSEMSVA